LHLAGKMRPFAGVRDRDLFAGLLAPGERSGIFRIQSSSARQFEGPLALHFFYLNVGRVGQPYLARVELPAWVAEKPASVDLLHATLFYQSRLLGARPYPYALHRAHEIAVVSYAEAEQLEQMLLGEMLRQGIYSFDESNKLHHKQTGGRTRHTL
ncbi:MAG TPA: DNA double-strand break repair nuclease NurA, partial [Anaerolineaceae bacterium]